MADLKALAPRQTLRLQLVHPVAGLQDAWITMAGPSHPVSREHAREELDRYMAEEDGAQDGRFTRAKLDRAHASLTRELVARTLGWEGLEEDGVEIPFSPEAAQKIYENPDNDWLRSFLASELRKSTLFFGT